MRGEKRDEQRDPTDPPRRRATTRRGRGTYATDRPPILGSVGRESGQVRWRVVANPQGQTRRDQVHRCTRGAMHLYADEYDGYSHLERIHSTVAQSHNEWARADDGAGIRDVHTNPTAGSWAGWRTILRPLRGVHKRFLSGYVAVHECRVNLKAMSVSVRAALIGLHWMYF